MHCPSCGAEYEPHVSTCPDCDAALVSDPALITPPTAHLGRFHPAVALEVAGFAGRRGIEPTFARPDDGEGVAIRVPTSRRDGLRADLMVAWPSLFSDLDPEDQETLRQLRGPLAGWYDAPEGAWVDRQGRLRAAPPREEEEAADADRALGPALVAIGMIVLVVAWYVGAGLLRLAAAIVGLALVLLGLFAPR